MDYRTAINELLDACDERGDAFTPACVLAEFVARMPATQEVLDRIPPSLAKTLDDAAFRRCLGGSGGPVLTIGEVADAAGLRPEILRLAGYYE